MPPLSEMSGEADRMIAIGLTGGVATGKSTVGKILRQKGVEVISSDALAHQAMMPGEPGYDKIVAEFGSRILLPDGEVNRRLLGEIVFKDDIARKRLEGIVHPIVINGIKQGLERCSKLGHKITVVEVPLLFEVGLMGLFDQVWVVSSTLERQKQRLLERDHLTEDQAKERIASQIQLEEKEKRADAVIDNNNGLDSLAEQVSILLKTLE